MAMINRIYIGEHAIDYLVHYCRTRQLGHVALIADSTTYKMLGQRVEQMLQSAGHEVTAIVLPGFEIIADEHYLVKALVQAPVGPCTFIAVGAGTITDITRFVSHRTGRSFIAMPTAPSVDGFTSVAAPLVLDGIKTTMAAQAPIALFADLETLMQAPKCLIAAGFGDLMGKLTALADWKLGSLLWNEPFDETIATRIATAVQTCIEGAADIGQRSESGIRRLMHALIECGLCMLEMGSSLPASGAEHHASHYWEMQLLSQHRPALLHGAKVGFALTHVAGQYAKIRELTQRDALNRLEAAVLPDRDQEIAQIREGYGSLLSEGVVEASAPFLNLTDEEFAALKQQIVAQWDAIQAVSASVPPQEQITAYLQQVGGPTTAQALGLSEEEVQLGMKYGHYLRNRFTVMKLSRILNVPLWEQGPN